MKENEGREGLTTPLMMETLEDRNAATSFGWLSFGSFGKLSAFHAPKQSHHGHQHSHWSLPSFSHGWGFSWSWGHGGCKGHQPPSPPPASPPPAVTPSVSGVVFQDLNNDGVRDAGEQAQGGRLVWVDSNGNGGFDAGEVSTTTAADGTYKLTNLPSGTALTVMSVNDNGTSSNGVTVTLGANEQKTDVNVALFLPPS